MRIDFHSLAKSGLRNLVPYQPGKPIEELERELGIQSSIKLASNENPLGPSPLAISILKDVLNNAHIYPDGACYELKQALANFHGVNADQITVGNGSENILELIVKSFLHADENAIISEYAFITIPLLVQSYGANACRIPTKNWTQDVTAIINAIDAKTRIVFLVNPNNPTGTYITSQEFQKLMHSVPPHVLVVVDQAYIEYITSPDYPQALNELHQYPNLILTRTFSKVYGLAALRLGYSISCVEIAEILNRARLPFNVNSIAAKAACGALQDQDHVRKSIALNSAGRLQLEEELQKLKLRYIPSIGNFISIEVGNAAEIYQHLLQQGVIVRPLAAYKMANHIRVTIGTAAQIERFLSALKMVMS